MVESINILTVDDDSAFVETTADILERRDARFDVETTTTVSEALDRLEDRAFDCVVSDYSMPGRSGIEFLKTVREEHPELPFIIFTGQGSEKTASKALTAGATEYLQKQRGDETYELLANRIRTCVEQYRTQQELDRTERYCQKLYRITSASDLDSEEKLQQLLKLGCERLDVENGHITRIDPETNRHEIALTAGSNIVEEGAVTDLEETFCRKTIQSEDLLAIYNARRNDWTGNPAHEKWDIGCYIGGKVEVRDTLFGTLCFANEHPREEPFTQSERVFVDLMTRGVSHVFERQHHEQNLQEYKSVLDTIADGVYVLDTDFEFTLVNQGLVELTGYSRDQLLGSHGSVIFEEEAIQEAQANRDRLQDSPGEFESLETEIQTADGESIPCEIRGRLLTPSGTEGPRVTAGVIRDITDRKRRERELKEQNRRLDKFASVISHDLRNPLNVAQGRLNLAQEECDSDHLDDIDSAHTRMEALLEDLLVLAREGQETTEKRPVELSEVAEQCWERVPSSEAALQIETDQRLRADITRLQQLLENLFRNAVKHGGNNVTITVGGFQTGFYVADDGSGIPKDDRDEIFEPGYSTAEEGTGFGLAIVKDVAEAHEWSIRVTESAESGARFEITDIEPIE